jgi:hypothetical protein
MNWGSMGSLGVEEWRSLGVEEFRSWKGFFAQI